MAFPMTRDNHGAELRDEATIDAVQLDNDRLRDYNADLRASALWWRLLYEAAVSRANELERTARDLANDRRA